MDWLQRLDVIVLVAMLAYTVVVVIFVTCRYRRILRAGATEVSSRELQRDRRQSVADLSIKVATLNSISVVAPYLGLAGTSLGLIFGFRGIDVEAESGLAALITARVVPVAIITTLGGLLVGTPAAWSYNYLRTRIDLLEIEIADDVPVRNRHSRFAHKFPLAARFSKTPVPLVAAPVLAILSGVVFMEYASYKTPTGLEVGVTPASRPCKRDGDQLIVLHVTDGGKVFLNQEPEEWNSLAGRLSDIYSLRLHRTLYIFADNGAAFQQVADAIDIAKSASVTGTSTSLDITVQLILPKAPTARARQSGPSGKTNSKGTESQTEGGSWDPVVCWDCPTPGEDAAFFVVGLVLCAPVFLLILRVRTRKRESVQPRRFLE
jgi:biopolymer transport protein ExbD